MGVGARPTTAAEQGMWRAPDGVEAHEGGDSGREAQQVVLLYRRLWYT